MIKWKYHVNVKCILTIETLLRSGPSVSDLTSFLRGRVIFRHSAGNVHPSK